MKKKNKGKLQSMVDRCVNNRLNEIGIETEITNIEYRLNQLECSHENVSFYIKNHGIGYPYCYGNLTCDNCEKVIERYADEISYLTAYIKHEEKVFSTNTEYTKNRIEKFKKELKELKEKK